jgi:hypothetical protein
VSEITKLGEVLVDGADTIADTFDSPDDDWRLMFFTAIAGEEIGVIRCPEWLANDPGFGKDLFAEVLAEVAKTIKPDAMGMVSGAWTRSARCKLCGELEITETHYGDDPQCPFEHDEEAALSLDDVLPRNAPDRIEAVVVSTWDAHMSQAWMARVFRTEGRPPTKGPWLTHGPEQHPDNVPTLGRWMDATVPVLRELVA